MICLRTTLRTVALAGALVALASAGRAQPVSKTAPVPVVTALFPYIGGEDVQKELKLDAEQVKKLLAHRQKQWDETWNTAPKDINFDARNKATEAEFKAVLTADQLKRANQLALQIVWNNPRGFGGFGGGPSGNSFTIALPPADVRLAPPSVLAQYSTIAEALKLDETQKKLVTDSPFGFGGRFGSGVYLTPDQSAIAKELLGAAYTGKLQPEDDSRTAFSGPGFGGGFGPGLGGGFGPGRFGAAPAIQYTAAPDVQKELKLTEAQIRQLGELRQKLGQPAGFEDYQATSPAARKKANDERLAEAEKALDTVLSADQRKRLKQIERQRQGSPRPDAEFYPSGALAKELGVTDAQSKRYEAIQSAHAETVAKALLADEPFEKVKAAFDAAVKAREKDLGTILTADQQAKRKEWLGEPFTGNVFVGGFPGSGPGGLGVMQRKLTFGRYSAQLTTLTRFKGVQEELKLKEEQIKKLTELSTEMRTKFPTQEMVQVLQDEEKGNKFFADRSAFVEKALTEVLTKEQQARFRELELQRLETPPQGAGGGFGGPSVQNTAASYPGVAEAIKLTDDQKKKILDGTRAADVLTDDQKKAITGMLGKPVKVAEVFAPAPGFAGPGPGSGPFGPRPALSAANQLILNMLVWDELKLDRDQLTRIARAANEYVLATGPRRVGGGPGGPGGFGGAFVQPDPKGLTAEVEAFGKAIDATLTADQKKRLDQLVVQQALANGLDVALLTPRGPDLAAKLGLSDEQKKKLGLLDEETTKIADLLDETFVPWETERDVRTKLRERLDPRLLAELTAEQKTKLKELAGEPFPGFTKQPFYGRGGGGGGFAGGGPFGP